MTTKLDLEYQRLHTYPLMPNTNAAIRALRKSERRKVSNLRQKREFLDVIKDYKKTVEAGDTASAIGKLSNVFKKLDKAAGANLIKKGKASRLKARLSKRLARANAPKVTPEG